MKRAISYLRFSTPRQEWGDSTRRQLKAARDYCEHNGLLLDDNGLADKGRSAYKGDHLKKGADLGDFLAEVTAGHIPTGTALIIENLDRLSRQGIDVTTDLLKQLTQNGIEVHAIALNRVLKAGFNSNLIDYVIIGVQADLAHQESQKKAERIGGAWRTKKENAGNGLALTKLVPAWLEAEKGQPPVIIPDRAATIRKIFHLGALGLGAYRITAQLTTDGDQPFVQGGFWTLPYIKKILKSRSVLGEFQPKKRVNGKRVNDGDPILNFFPQIVTHEEWNAARSSVADRTRNYATSKTGYVVCGGRTGSGTNLFTGLLFDVSLGGRSMAFRGKSGRTKADYLVTAYKAKEPQHSMLYDRFERRFLGFLQDLDWRKIAGESEPAETALIRADLEKVAGEIVATERMLGKLQTLKSDPNGTKIRHI